MKDALGHGSEAGGSTHAEAISKLPAKMTRAHFEQIAAQLRTRAEMGGSDADHQARVNAMADHLATTNPGFRRDLFVKASQPGTSYKDRSTRDITKKNASKALGKYGAAVAMNPRGPFVKDHFGGRKGF